ncbi:MAG: hypothetical protein N4A71_11995 [Carboxylicivirga sp.]|jgi:hypothetical protein|nr:hypothetical protein [Carboxylicivirga sp.]
MSEFKFAERRDFSGVINGAFSFFKQEGLMFSKALLTYTGIPMLIIIAAIIHTAYRAMNGAFAGLADSPDPGTIFSLVLPIIVIVFLAIILQIMVMAISYGYIKVYHEKGKGNFPISEVGRQIVGNFFPIIGYTIVTSILIMAGLVLFILPGIYFSIILSLIFPIMFIEDKGLGRNFNRCFQVIKDNWWITFAILIVASIIIGIVSSIISVPLQVYVQIKIPIIAQSGNWEQLNIPFIMISYILLIVLSTYLRSFVYVVTGLQYFSLSEKDGSTTIMDRINQIGSEDANNLNSDQK